MPGPYGSELVIPIDGDTGEWIRPLQERGPVAVLPDPTAIVLAEYAFTRPANTTQYTAGDIVAKAGEAAAMQFGNIPQGGYITAVALIDSVNAATLLQPELWILDRAPQMSGFEVDNIGWAPIDADMARVVDVIALTNSFVGGATAGSGASTIFKANNLNIPYYVETGILFGVLVARNTYTPASAEVFTLRIWIDRR